MEIRYIYAACLLIGSVHLTIAQFPFVGKCPEPKVQENFDINRFSGQWFEIERTMSLLEIGSQCTSANYSDSGYGDGSVEVISEGQGPVLKLKKSVRVIAKVPDRKEPAKMRVRLSDLQLKFHYWVLSTDYDNYAIIWGCNHVWLAFSYARTENMWILSRERTLSEEAMNKIYARIDTYKGIKTKKLLMKVNQKNCD